MLRPQALLVSITLLGGCSADPSRESTAVGVDSANVFGRKPQPADAERPLQMERLRAINDDDEGDGVSIYVGGDHGEPAGEAEDDSSQLPKPGTSTRMRTRVAGQWVDAPDELLGDDEEDTTARALAKQLYAGGQLHPERSPQPPPTYKVAVGRYHVCALNESTHDVRCWGDRYRGLLGGDVSPPFSELTQIDAYPAPIRFQENVGLIAAGELHTCFSTLDGLDVYCFGTSGYAQAGRVKTRKNPYGHFLPEFGNNYHAVPAKIDIASISRGSTIVQSAAGWKNTCVLFANGTVGCWGDNTYGQIGGPPIAEEDALSPRFAPVRFAFPERGVAVLQDFRVWDPRLLDLGANRVATAVAVGDHHVCVILNVVEQGATVQRGAIKCWGEGWQPASPDLDADRIAGSRPIRLGVATTIAAAGGETCAAFQDDGMKCFAARSGIVSVVGRKKFFEPSGAPQDDGAASSAEIPVVQVALAREHGCALLGDRSISCWGSNASGALGTDGALTEDVDLEHAVQVVPQGRAVSVSVGAKNSCFVEISGNVFCWGENDHGTLGIGAPGPLRTTASEPVRFAVQ